jgi:acetylornithine/succinyldiaminopimelate/putrescine aminotransferase
LRTWICTAGDHHKRKLVIVRGQGATFGAKRKGTLTASAARAANIGHQNPYVNKALQEQSQKLVNCTELFYNDQRAALLETLARLTPPASPGFSATPVPSQLKAFKFARLATGRTECNYNAWLSRKIHGCFERHLEQGVPSHLSRWYLDSRVPFDNLEKTCQAITEKTAAFIMEPVQGESGCGGVARLLQELRSTAAKPARLLLNGVQTGFCRTGKCLRWSIWHRARHPLPGKIAGRRCSNGCHWNQRSRVVQLSSWRTRRLLGQSAGLCGGDAAIRYMEDFQLASVHRIWDRSLWRIAQD